MTYIQLSKGMQAVVDADISEHIKKYKWYVTKGGGSSAQFYAVTHTKGVNKKIRMNRFVWELVNGSIPPKADIDHISRDTLDNRISNLRLATRSQNNINSKVRKDNTTGYKGVFYVKGRKTPYWAYIRINNKRKGLGMYKTAEEASEAYKAAALEAYGEFAA